MKKSGIKKAAVLTYSQTGHTRLYGRLIAAVWEREGIKTKTADIGGLAVDSLSSFDLIMAGTPVFYYDVPSNVIDLLSTAPRLDDIPVAAFATYGGKGGNQHNTARRLLMLLKERGGIPVGTETFGNMSTFAPTWSIGSERRILKYKDFPDARTFRRVSQYARLVLARAQKRTAVMPGREFYIPDLLKGGPSIAFTKLFVGRHRIDPDACTGCGVCEKGCPVEAIDLNASAIDTKRCIACFGCVNNCPANAVDMTYFGKKVYGFREFKKRHGRPDIQKL